MADKYTNILFDHITESGSNTLTFNELNFGLSLFDKVGILISRLEWVGADLLLLATGDQVSFGICTSNTWTGPDPSHNSIITYMEMAVRDYGTAGNNKVFTRPLVQDFSTLPSGGLLSTPRPLFMFSEGANLGSASHINMRMFFTIIQLKAEEYFELLETRQFFG